MKQVMGTTLDFIVASIHKAASRHTRLDKNSCSRLEPYCISCLAMVFISRELLVVPLVGFVRVVVRTTYRSELVVRILIESMVSASR